MQLIENPLLRKPKSDITIARIKLKDNAEKLEIIYELPPEDTETKKVTYKCEERPNDAFFKALKLVEIEAIALCRLNWDAAIITDLSFKTTGEEDLISFTVIQTIEDREVAVSVKSWVPSYSFREKINNFLAEVEDYISGKRAQQTLFDTSMRERVNTEQVAGLGF